MKRSKLREHVFQLLFISDFHDRQDMPEQFELYLQQFAPMLSSKGEEDDEIISPDAAKREVDENKDEIYARFSDVNAHLDVIDNVLSKATSGWTLNRMNKTDLIILRLAVYEIMFDENVPERVAINEAVELAKAYGGLSSPSFVNGILAKVVKK